MMTVGIAALKWGYLVQQLGVKAAKRRKVDPAKEFDALTLVAGPTKMVQYFVERHCKRLSVRYQRQIIQWLSL